MRSEVSQTALTAAAARAAHLVVDREPHVFADPLAERLLGERAAELVGYHRRHGDHPILAGARAQVVVRARIAEDELAGSGLDQYVILGAGLDSFAYRSPLAGTVRVFEVDHPATQAAKRAAGLTPRGALWHVPVDFETDDLGAALAAAGLDTARPAFVSWLGVSMYLTADAIARTLDDLAGLAPGSRIVLDYLLPPELRDPLGQAYADAVGAVAAERGEPWLSFFRPEEMAAALAARGFAGAVSIGQHEILTRPRADALRPAALSMVALGTRLA